jgi:hypothetical protein
MGDAAEGLIDADARIQERMEELEQERARKHVSAVRDPELIREIESLRLARLELERQLGATAHEARRAQLAKALEEIGRRMADARARLG